MELLHRIPNLILVILVTTGLMAFLVSYLRYRRLELIAKGEQASGAAMSPASVVIHLLAVLRKEERLLCRIHSPDQQDGTALRDFLKEHTRKGDVHLAVEGGVVISTFECSLDHARALADRLAGLLKRHGIQEGALCVWEPLVEPRALFDWICQEEQMSTGTMSVSVDVVSDVPEETPASHPAVDPETGVLRMELVSRAIRRQLAESSRMEFPALILRVSPRSVEEPEHVLPDMARILMASCRETDLIGRSGVDEIVLCIPTSLDQGMPMAMRMSEDLRQHGLEVAMGLAAMPEHGKQPNVLFERAGKAKQKAGDMEAEPVQVFEELSETAEATEETESFGKEVF